MKEILSILRHRTINILCLIIPVNSIINHSVTLLSGYDVWGDGVWYHFDAGHEMEWLHHKWSCDGARWALIGGHNAHL